MDYCDTKQSLKTENKEMKILWERVREEVGPARDLAMGLVRIGVVLLISIYLTFLEI